MSNKTQLQTNNTNLASLTELLRTKGTATPTLQEKTVSPSTSAQAVTPDSGYDGLSKVNVNAMPSATQATPSITVSSGGLITASATQSAGYVPSGTKSATKQLTTQAAKTVTPTTSNQTAVASGRYTTGAVTVKGDANLVPANIVSGKSIFGVSGSATTGEDVTAETNAYTAELAELTTAVTALEEELAGKAAGGGGGLQVATGTCINYDIVSLGFTPTFVLIFGDSTSTLNYNDVFSCFGTLGNETFNNNIYVSFSNVDRGVHARTLANYQITLTDDGFEILFDNEVSSYKYIAIG